MKSLRKKKHIEREWKWPLQGQEDVEWEIEEAVRKEENQESGAPKVVQESGSVTSIESCKQVK